MLNAIQLLNQKRLLPPSLSITTEPTTQITQRFKEEGALVFASKFQWKNGSQIRITSWSL